MDEETPSRRADWPYPFWFGHRGAGKMAPENTLAAFRHGLAHGWRAFECDVKLSADGVPFLLHDATLERTTNGHGVAGEQPWLALSQLDAGSWHGPAFAGEAPASLNDVAAFCLSQSVALNIEIKPTPGQEAETGRVVARAASRLWRQSGAEPLLSSFDTEALRAARAEQPHCQLALLLETLWPGWLGTAMLLGCTAVVLHQSLADAASAAAIRSASMRWLAYTVNDRDVAARMIESGASGLISDTLISAL